MSAYEARKQRLLHKLQLHFYWQRWTDLSYYGWDGRDTLTDYAVKKMCRELESEGLIKIRMKSSGWFHRYEVKAVDEISLEQFKKFHPSLKFRRVETDIDGVHRIWSSKRWFWKPDSPFRYCEDCIDYPLSAIFGVLNVPKYSTRGDLSDIPFWGGS